MEKKKTPSKVGTVRYRSDGSKVKTVSFDGDIDYRAGMAEAVKKANKYGSPRKSMGTDAKA